MRRTKRLTKSERKKLAECERFQKLYGHLPALPPDHDNPLYEIIADLELPIRIGRRDPSSI